MKIVNFGSCNIDHVYKLEHIVGAGETEHSQSAETFPGGKGLNQSIAIARAGAEVFHAGCVGRDDTILKNALLDSGVDISFLKVADLPCGHAIIQVDQAGENAIFIYTGANGCFSTAYIDETLSHFGQEDLVILQNEINNIDYIIDRASLKGMKILLNPSPINEAIKKVDLDKIEYIVLNRIEGEALSGEKQPRKIISFFQKTHPRLKTVLTLGDKGCIYYDGAKTNYQPAFDVHTVDSTAAGDTFTGYFAAALSQKMTSHKTLKWASAAAALAVSKVGASPSIPYKNEVEEAIGHLRQKESDIEPLKNTRDLIDEYIEKDPVSASLEGLSKELGYSRVYAGHLVKKATNVTFSKYLLEKRCAIAAENLQKSNRSVNEIIESVGYNNHSYFRKAFKELYGVSPASYRKAQPKEKPIKGGK